MTLYERHMDRVLDRPVLVVALEGWVDAGLGADGAISALLSAAPTELVATFDGESLIDQLVNRSIRIGAVGEISQHGVFLEASIRHILISLIRWRKPPEVGCALARSRFPQASRFL